MKNLPTISELKDMLEKGICEVQFTKQNGEIRTMKCTMKPDLLAETAGNERDIPHNLIVVTDIEKNAWRSFNYSQIESVQLLG